MIHSRSYTYIIKNVYSDPGEVFDHILDDEKIVSRAASVTGAYNDFIVLHNNMEIPMIGNMHKKKLWVFQRRTS